MRILSRARILFISTECLSRQSSLVINIVGTDDISRLPRFSDGFDRSMGGGGGLGRSSTTPPCCPVYTPQSVVS